MNLRRAAAGLAAVPPILLVVCIALHPLLEPDVFWHLASGRWILDHRAIPRTDVLTYTLADHPWLNFQWLFDVVLVGAWRWAGADALVLGKVLALAVVAWLLVRAARAAGAGAAAATFAVTLHAVASAERTTVRPEVFSYIALAAIVLIIETARRGNGRAGLVATPALVALWINVHSLAFLGPLLLFLHGALAFVDERLPDRWRESAPPKRLARDFLVAGAASAIAMLANPFGLAAWKFPLTLFRRVGPDREIFARILEFGRPLDAAGDAALRGFWILLGVLVVSFAARGRTLPVTRLASLVPFLALALLARRNIPLLSIAAVPVLAANLAELGRRVAQGRSASAQTRMNAVANAGAAAFAIVLAIAVLAGASPRLFGLYRERGLGVMVGLFPEDALQTLDRSIFRGRIFHDLDFGGYIAWRDPERRTFIDGRLEVAGAEWLRRFIDARENPEGWQRLVREWQPEILLVGHSSRGDAAFLRAMLSSGEWTPMRLSAEAALLVKTEAVAAAGLPATTHESWTEILGESRGAEPHAGSALAPLTRPLDALLKPSPAPAAVRRAMRFANLQLTLNDPRSALAGYEAVLNVAPRDPEALFNRGLCALHEGRPEDARRLWQDALDRVDRGSRAMFTRALAEIPR